MHQIRAVVLGGLLALGCAGKTAATAAAPSGPPPEDAAAYYPLLPGWKWAYDVEKGSERILAVYAVTEKNGDTVVIQTGEERMNYALFSEGIARRDGLAIGDYILKSPIRPGADWPIAGGRAKIASVGRTVTVAAGTFTNCATVEESRTDPLRVIRTTYAPGVGPVTLEYQVHDAASGQFTMVMRASLRGMTRPGEDALGN
jgi:hypothetical protein